MSETNRNVRLCKHWSNDAELVQPSSGTGKGTETYLDASNGVKRCLVLLYASAPETSLGHHSAEAGRPYYSRKFRGIANAGQDGHCKTHERRAHPEMLLGTFPIHRPFRPPHNWTMGFLGLC